MKIWRLALAAVLAAGAVAAYVYFPNPMEQASRAEAPASPAHPAEEATTEQPPAGGESI